MKLPYQRQYISEGQLLEGYFAGAMETDAIGSLSSEDLNNAITPSEELPTLKGCSWHDLLLGSGHFPEMHQTALLCEWLL